MKKFSTTANLVFGIFLVFSSAVVAALVSVAWRLGPTAGLAWKNFFSRNEVVCGCNFVMSWQVNTIAFVLYLAVGAVLLGLVLWFFAVIIKNLSDTKRFIRRHIYQPVSVPSPRLLRAARTTGLSGRMIEILSDRPVIFCYGFLRRRICISSSLVASLKNTELEACLRHEKAHVNDFGPLKILCMNIISQALFFVPGLRSLITEYRVVAELAADEAATNGFSRRRPLARALYKMLQWEEAYDLEPGGLAFFSSLMSQRVEHLRFNNKSLMHTYGRAIISSAAALAFVVILLVIGSSTSRVVYAGATAQSCREVVIPAGSTCSAGNAACFLDTLQSHSYCVDHNQ